MEELEKVKSRKGGVENEKRNLENIYSIIFERNFLINLKKINLNLLFFFQKIVEHLTPTKDTQENERDESMDELKIDINRDTWKFSS